MNPPLKVRGKYKRLTVKEKLELLQCIDSGKTVSSVAEKYGIGQTTVFNIRNDRSSIEKFASDNPEAIKTAKRTTNKSQFHDLDDTLYGWFTDQISKQEVVTQISLRKKASSLYMKMYPGNDTRSAKKKYNVSRTWIWKFKLKYGIKSRPVCVKPPTMKGIIIPDKYKLIRRDNKCFVDVLYQN